MADLQKIVDELSTLTVMEAAELSKMLEEHWGVSAAAPVAAAAARGGARRLYRTGSLHALGRDNGGFGGYCRAGRHHLRLYPVSRSGLSGGPGLCGAGAALDLTAVEVKKTQNQPSTPPGLVAMRRRPDIVRATR